MPDTTASCTCIFTDGLLIKKLQWGRWSFYFYFIEEEIENYFEKQGHLPKDTKLVSGQTRVELATFSSKLKYHTEMTHEECKHVSSIQYDKWTMYKKCRGNG